MANSTHDLAQLLATGIEGIATISKHFETCVPIRDSLDPATLVVDAMGTLQGIVQGNHRYSANMSTISIMCVGLCDPSTKCTELSARGMCHRCGLMENANSSLDVLKAEDTGIATPKSQRLCEAMSRHCL